MKNTSVLFIKWLMSMTGPSVVKQFREQCASPTEVQKQLLEHILLKNREAQFGKDHGFKNISSIRDFQSQVPIAAYEDLKPYIDKALLGEPAQLTIEKPIFFAMTSGTTGSPKFIPVTPESDGKKSELMRVWSAKLAMDHPQVCEGKVLTVVSPAVECCTPDGTPCGSETGHAFLKMPELIKSFYSCPYEVFEMEDYEMKYYLLLRIAAAQNIKVIYTCNPSTVFLLGKRLAQFSNEIIRDIHDGTISDHHPMSLDLALILKNYIKRDPGRAKILEEAAKKGEGALLAKHVWPQMAMICCWKGGSVSLYLPKFSRFFPEKIPVRDIGYFSSEFRGSIPLSDEDRGGVLTVPGNFYEFFPSDEDRKPEGRELLTLDQLEQGKKYFIYVTTLAGLYRYDMNDVIEVTGFYENTPLIRFVQKGRGVISFTGEKLSESQVTEAVRRAFDTFNGPYEFIAAVGELQEEAPRYVFLFEFERPVEAGCLKQLAWKIEQALCDLNVEYAAKRKSNRIQPLVLRIVKPGAFDSFRKRSIEARNTEGQFKILKLTSDESFSRNFEIQMEISAAA